MKDILEKYLKERNDHIGYVFPDISTSDLFPLRLSDQNPMLSQYTWVDTARFNQLIFDQLLRGKVGIGGYMERRSIYRRSSLYTGEETRSIHLGVDVWAPAGTALRSPLVGEVHSFQDNSEFGDYGPTIILKHQLKEVTFYTLYGHLSRASLLDLSVGQPIAREESLGTLGDFPENGDWPPHLHFQVITDMLGKAGDFPGVVAPSEQDFYQSICIDPMLMLKFKE